MSFTCYSNILFSLTAITDSTQLVTNEERKAHGSNLTLLWLLCLFPVILLMVIFVFCKGTVRALVRHIPQLYEHSPVETSLPLSLKAKTEIIQYLLQIYEQLVESRSYSLNDMNYVLINR